MSSIRSKELIATLAKMTHLPHDEVKLVLDALRQLTVSQLEILGSIVIPGMMKVECRQTAHGNYVVRISPYRALFEAVGREIKWVKTVKPPYQKV